MASKPLTTARANELIDISIRNDEVPREDRVAALLELMNGINDPSGDLIYSGIRFSAMRYAFTLTREFEQSFEEYMENGRKPEIDHQGPIS